MKTVIITGANSGIGKKAAQKFAKEGYKVIMACRNMDKGKRAQQEIIDETMNNEVYLKEVDLASFDSIRSFCNNFKKEFKKLDILIHNAAYFNHGDKYRLSPDNIELTFATNVFGPFLMTNLLIEQLKATEDPRILHAVSNIIKHFFSPKKEISFDNIQGWKNDEKSYSVYKSYRDSKMVLTMLTFKMAQELEREGIKVNALQINGAKMSKETIKKFKPLWRPIAWIQNIFFPEPEIMAKNYFEICTSDKFKNVSGKLFNHRLEIMEPGEKEPGIMASIKQLFGANLYPRYANHKKVTEKIWELSGNLTDPKI
ncbi:MAG: SDR family NAD(P)-dependent oxidoreductase [Halanaerobiales bacterium]